MEDSPIGIGPKYFNERGRRRVSQASPFLRDWPHYLNRKDAGCALILTAEAAPPKQVSARLTLMTIEIRDPALEARLKKQIEVTGSSTVEETLLRLLETQEEQDRWLAENREAINAKIRRGIEQVDRGEGIPEDRLDNYLADLKSKSQ